MPSPEELERKETQENESLANSESFSKTTILAFLHNLIANCASLLEDAKDLLEDCYYSQKALFELLSSEPEQPFMHLLNIRFPNWYGDNKHASTLNQIIGFSKHFVKEGIIAQSLVFLLMLRKEFSPMFMKGNASFIELQNCYERINRFQPNLVESLPFFNEEIDAFIVWIENNQETLEALDDLILDEIDELDCKKESTSHFIKHLAEFCIDLKTRLITQMLIHIDEEGRTLGLCPPHNADTENRGLILFEQYSQNLTLSQKINYLVSLGVLNVSEALKTVDAAFQNRVNQTKDIDKRLGPIKRIAYLDQSLDPKVHFSSGFCAGDGINWCLNMLTPHDNHSQSINLINHFTSRQSLHAEWVSDNSYHLQMAYQYDIVESTCFCTISFKENATHFCEEIFDSLQAKTAQNQVAMSFAVILYGKNVEGHQLSFCRFFKHNIEFWRIRDLNYGEFEGNFSDLKEWYTRFYSNSVYTLSLQYTTALLKETIVNFNKTIPFDNDKYHRILLAKQLNHCSNYEIFADRLHQESLKIYSHIHSPSLRDNLIQIFNSCVPYFEQCHSNPKQVLLVLNRFLKQVIAFENKQYSTIQKSIELALLIALFNDGQFDAFTINLHAVLSSIDTHSLKHEDAIILTLFHEQAKSFTMMLDKEKRIQKIQEMMSHPIKTLAKSKRTIKTTLTELKTMNHSNKGILKRIDLLFQTFLIKRLSFALADESFFNEMLQFQRTGSQESPIHPSIQKAMETFIHALEEPSMKQRIYGLLDEPQKSIFCTPKLLCAPEGQIPRPLTFMKTAQDEVRKKWIKEYQDEIRWQQWIKEEYKEPFPGAKERGFGPGAVVVYRSF